MTNATIQINDHVARSHTKIIKPPRRAPRPSLEDVPCPPQDKDAAAKAMRLSILADLLSPNGSEPDVIGAPMHESFNAELAADEFDDSLLYVPGAWHARDGNNLKRALAWVATSKPGLLPLARILLPRLPRRLLSSSTLKTDQPTSRYEPMNRAVRHQWLGMQAKGQRHINVLTLDCDKDGWRERLGALIARGLPRPTFTTVSPAKWDFGTHGTPSPIGRGHDTAHLSWLLRHPVSKENRLSYDLFTRTRQALMGELGADECCAGHIGKNPFHDAYLTEVGSLEPISLKDITDPMIAFCGADEYWLGKRTVMRDGGQAYRPGHHAFRRIGNEDMGVVAPWGRHFEVRHKVYAAGVTDYETILAMAQEHAAACGSEARSRQIQSTARSIHRFMVNGRFGKGLRPGVDHGVMSREHADGSRPVWRGLSKKDKQGRSGMRSAAIRKARTTTAIAREVLRALRKGDVITQVSLAKAVGLGLRRIQELWGRLAEIDEDALRSVQVLGLRGTSKPLGSSSSPALTLRQLADLSREQAAFVRAQAEAVAAYRAIAAAMRRPGAQPRAVPPQNPTLRSQEVGEAYRSATAALRDCKRRQENRRLNAERAARRAAKLATFKAWAAVRDIAAFDRFMADVKLKWDAQEQATVDRRQGSTEFVEKLRRSELKRHWRDWKDACLQAGLRNRPLSPSAAAWHPSRQAPPMLPWVGGTVPAMTHSLNDYVSLSVAATDAVRVAARVAASTWPYSGNRGGAGE